MAQRQIIRIERGSSLISDAETVIMPFERRSSSGDQDLLDAEWPNALFPDDLNADRLFP